MSQNLLLLFSGIYIFAAIDHIFIAFRDRQRLTRILFSAMCFLAAVYSLLLVGSYRANDIDTYLLTFNSGIITGNIFFIVLIWFTARYTNYGKNSALILMSLLLAITVIVNQIYPYGIFYAEVHQITRYTLPWGEEISVLAGEYNSWIHYNWFTLLLALAYVLSACAHLVKTHPRKIAIPFNVAMGIFTLTVIDDFMIDYNLIQFIYMGQYGFFALIILMHYTLTIDLKYRESLLKRKETQLRLALEATNIAAWEQNIDTGEVFWSDGAEVLFNKPRDYFVKHKPDFNQLLAPSEQALLKNAIDSADISQPTFSAEYAYRFSDSSLHWLSQRGEVIFDVSGKAESVRGTVVDITHRKLIEDDLRQHKEELEKRVEARTTELKKANEELESFSYSVSHDLRAPLRRILGFGEALKEGYADSMDDNARDYIERIDANVKRMNELIEDMLALSNISRSSLSIQNLNLGAMADEIWDQIREQNPSRTIGWKTAENIPATGDRRLLKIALENLLGNAWKYTKKTPDPMVEFGTENQNGSTVFYVRDNGAGFEMESAENLFKVFHRLHREDDFAGNGIGLATVSRVVQRHKGKVWATAEPRKGAAFYFTLDPNRDD